MTRPDAVPAAQRRALAREARDAFPPMGVYAVRDRSTGRVQVLASRHAPAAVNRLLFELRLGTHRDRDLQAAWRDGGADRIAVDVLELVRERAEPGFDPEAELAAMARRHRAALQPGEAA